MLSKVPDFDSDDAMRYAQASNMGVEDLSLAAKVMAATQALNTRAKKDLTYHLIVSFREGEQPTPEQLADIEQTICERLGFGSHHRLSALHTDTAHAHLHLAISRVDPDTLKVVDPHRDFYILDQACKDLEQRYQLQIDNRIDRHSYAERAGQPDSQAVTALESHSGIRSFRGWLREDEQVERFAALRSKVATWADLHGELASAGLTLRPRGAGLVITDGKVWAKASAIDRVWSRGSLEADFGEFIPPSASQDKRQKARASPYQPKPEFGRDSGLWTRYQKERVGQSAAWQDRKRARSRVYDHYRDLFDLVAKDRVMSRQQRKERLENLKQSRARGLADVAREHSVSPSRTWVEFLADHAATGNIEALRLLRQRQQRAGDDDTRQGFTGPASDYIDVGRQPFVQKSGAVLYRLKSLVSKTARRSKAAGGQRRAFSFADHGDTVAVHGQNSSGVADALDYARRKWQGTAITIVGDEAWQRHVVHCAVREDVEVSFANPELEDIRQQLLQQPRKEQTNRRQGGRRKATSQDAVDRWIKERNRTGRRVPDYVRIKRFTKGALKGVYRGVRSCGDDMQVALVQVQDAMVAIPVSSYQRRRWQANRVGQNIRINARGQLLSQKEQGLGR